MKKKSFVFYRSFYDVIAKADDSAQLKVYQALCDFCLNGNEPNLDSMSDSARKAFCFIKSQMNNITKKESLLLENRQKLDVGIKKLAFFHKCSPAYIWSDLYSTLDREHGIKLKNRGRTPYIQWTKEKEWETVFLVFTNMCKGSGADITKIFPAKLALGQKPHK